MLAKIAVTVLAIVVVLAVVVALRPSEFRIARSRVIAAPASVIYAQLADLHAWARWMPFDEMDPTVTKTFAGPATGVGSSYEYRGEKIGTGRMTITGLTPDRRVDVLAEFVKPMVARNEVAFTLEPRAGSTTVTWAMTGRNDFIGKAFGLFVDIDKMVGKDFERGLANLGRVAEQNLRAIDVAAR